MVYLLSILYSCLTQKSEEGISISEVWTLNVKGDDKREKYSTSDVLRIAVNLSGLTFT